MKVKANKLMNGSMMGFLYLFLSQVEVQFVDVVERHLVSVSSK
jgi:hypothetical protein